MTIRFAIFEQRNGTFIVKRDGRKIDGTDYDSVLAARQDVIQLIHTLSRARLDVSPRLFIWTRRKEWTHRVW